MSGVSLAFFFTPFGAAFQALVLRCQTCKGLAYLLLYIFFANLGLYRTGGLLVASAVVAAVVVVAATTVIIIATAVVVTAAVIAASAAFASVIGGLTTCLLDIYLLLAGDAAAFLTVAFGITALGRLAVFAATFVFAALLGRVLGSSPKGR